MNLINYSELATQISGELNMYERDGYLVLRSRSRNAGPCVRLTRWNEVNPLDDYKLIDYSVRWVWQRYAHRQPYEHVRELVHVLIHAYAFHVKLSDINECTHASILDAIGSI